jgi:hypothetical protein
VRLQNSCRIRKLLFSIPHLRAHAALFAENALAPFMSLDFGGLIGWQELFEDWFGSVYHECLIMRSLFLATEVALAHHDHFPSVFNRTVAVLGDYMV